MRIALAVGCFDMLHAGHHDLLRRASHLGRLVVAVDTDERVRQLKGPGRPIVPLAERALMLTDLKCVYSVLSFDSEDRLRQIIRGLQPAILVKGQGSGPTPGQEFCERVEYLPLLPGWSTTAIVERLKNGS